MDTLAQFKQYYSLSAKLIEEMTKDQLADVARLLALHVADYQSRFGEMPRPNLFQLLAVTEINADQAKLLLDGMQTLTGYLALVLDAHEDHDDVVH